jgi:hypothetical protein
MRVQPGAEDRPVEERGWTPPRFPSDAERAVLAPSLAAVVADWIRPRPRIHDEDEDRSHQRSERCEAMRLTRVS